MVYGVSMETTGVRPPPARTINALPGHTTRADEPESLRADGSLAPPKHMEALMTFMGEATFGIALEENRSIDVVRLRGAVTIKSGLSWYRHKGLKVVRLPDEFYSKLGIDPQVARALPTSQNTPWGVHLAVMEGITPFFICCDVHPGSTLCGPHSRYWDGDAVCATLHAGMNTERALAGLPLIDEEVSLFALHGFDPAEAGRRATARLEEDPEWTHPCIRGGKTTAAEWKRLKEGHDAGTLDDDDESKLSLWLDHSARGGKTTAAEWKRLQEGHDAGTLDDDDESKLSLWLDHSARGGKTTAAEWKRLKEGHDAGTLDDDDESKLSLWLGKTTAAEWKRLQEGHDAGTLDDDDESKLSLWLDHSARGGKAGGKAKTAEWNRLKEGRDAGTLDDDEERKLALWRQVGMRSGATTTTVEDLNELFEGAALTTSPWLTYDEMLDGLKNQKGYEIKRFNLIHECSEGQLRYGWIHRPHGRGTKVNGRTYLKGLDAAYRARRADDVAEAVGMKDVELLTVIGAKQELKASGEPYRKRDTLGTLRDAVRKLRARKQEESEAAASADTDASADASASADADADADADAENIMRRAAAASAAAPAAAPAAAAAAAAAADTRSPPPRRRRHRHRRGAR